MATLATAAVRDNSTLANFKQWAQVISNFFTTAGWVQSGDTGQVNWGTIASVPTAGNYVYEIWQPNDGLTTFYLKVEYGTNTASTNTGPQFRISLGTSTNGAGTLSGNIAGPFALPQAGTTVAVTSTSTQWNCYLSGAVGRMNVAMWTNDTTTGSSFFFGVARSKNSSGTTTATHVTLTVAGYTTNNSTPYGRAQTVVFGTGVTTDITGFTTMSLPLIMLVNQANWVFGGGNTMMSPYFPPVGYFDNPLIEFGGAAYADTTDQTSFTIAGANMPYGTSHTYLALRNSAGGNVPLGGWATGRNQNVTLLMLFE